MFDVQKLYPFQHRFIMKHCVSRGLNFDYVGQMANEQRSIAT